VRLQRQLSAEFVLIVDEKRLYSQASKLDRSVNAGRSAADDKHFHAMGLDILHRLQLVVGRKSGKPVETFHAKSGSDLGHARLDRDIVREHQALRALTVRAENPLRAAVLLVMPENVNSPGKKCGRDHFALVCDKRLAVERERNLATPRNVEYRVGLYAMLFSQYFSVIKRR